MNLMSICKFLWAGAALIGIHLTSPFTSMLLEHKMSAAMLNDPVANHTKPIENYFGNLDREVQKSGPQGFDKATSDLIIKYSKDLLSTQHEWYRKAAVVINLKQTNFDKQQQLLASKGVDNLDAGNLCTANKVIKCISDCQKSHNGPIMDTDTLHKLVDNLAGDEKHLNRALNLEIRFHKFTLTEVKDTFPLFKQKGLSVTRVKNLETLINSQLELRALADMDDLEAAINEADNDKNNEPDNTPPVSNVEVSNLSNRAKKANEGPSESHDEPLQFKEKEFVIAV